MKINYNNYLSLNIILKEKISLRKNGMKKKRLSWVKIHIL